MKVKLFLCLLNTTLSRVVGGLGTVPRTRVLSLCTEWRLGSASGDGRFTTLSKPHPTPPTLATALLSTSSWGPTSRSGDRTVVLITILTEIFWGRSKCAYSSVRNIKLTLFFLLNVNRREGKRLFYFLYFLYFVFIFIDSPTLAVGASKLNIHPMQCVQFLSSWWWAEKRPETSN